MATIKVLLVDDEYLALNLLEAFIQNLPDLEIVGKVKSPIAALEVLSREPVDLLFLDIQMPTLSGSNLLKTLKNPPLTIFTTAYAEHALEAFDLNAVDYLLKPFSFERFLQAVNKAREQLKLRTLPPAPPTPDPQNFGASRPPSTVDRPPFLTAKVDGKLVKIHLDDILFIEGLKEYVRFICRSSKHVTLESLKNLEDQLPADRFLRVHKSYIVATGKVQSALGNMLEIPPHKIPISRGRRDEVVQAIFGGEARGEKREPREEDWE